jgi:hypothetical protein
VEPDVVLYPEYRQRFFLCEPEPERVFRVCPHRTRWPKLVSRQPPGYWQDLPVQDSRFADAVAACVLFASVGMHDCYLADADAAEVYLAHHHDKVVVSIPDAAARGGLLRELEDAAWLFTDVSGYGSSLDEEDEEDSL